MEKFRKIPENSWKFRSVSAKNSTRNSLAKSMEIEKKIRRANLFS